MPRPIVVLGAGVYHIPLIKQIEALGHQVLAASFLANDPALQYASMAKNISSTDVEALTSLITENNVGAILTTASDWNTFSQAELNERFGFTGVRPWQVEAVSEKHRFNELLEKLNLPHPESEVVILSEKLFFEYQQRGKFIFKPVKGSGSADVFTTQNSYPKHLSAKQFLVQNYIEGNELGGQALVEDGKIVFLALSKKVLVNEVVPFAHVLGLQEANQYVVAVVKQLQLIVSELEFESGTINVDIRQSNNVPYIIDLSFRLSGNGLIEAINCSRGVNLFDYHIKQVLQEPRELTSSNQKMAVSIVFGSKNEMQNLVDLRDTIESALKRSAITIKELVWDELDVSEPFVKSKNRLGHVVFTAESEAEIDAVIFDMKELLGFN